MYRSDSYDKKLSQKLKIKKFAQAYFLALIQGDDGLEIEDALKITIQRMGVTDFANLIGLPKSNVAEFLSGKRRLKMDSLDKYLKPFNLKTELVLKKVA